MYRRHKNSTTTYALTMRLFKTSSFFLTLTNITGKQAVVSPGGEAEKIKKYIFINNKIKNTY